MKQNKIYHKGDIVYWCHQEGHYYNVNYGMVDVHIIDEGCNIVYVDYLSIKEQRLVNGIPYNEFKDETRYKKLPKGWNYDTKLFEITYDESISLKDVINLDIYKPSNVKTMYDNGIIVKMSKIDQSYIEAIITKEGYRLVKKIDKLKPTYATIRPDKLYNTYEEALAECKANEDEFYRQASLSDYEWSLEQIDKDIIKYLTHSDGYYGFDDYHNWFIYNTNIEDVETRVFLGQLQWKYWKNKRWATIEL